MSHDGATIGGMRAAIGCRDHSGWAVLVGVGGDPAAPTVLARERVTLVEDDLRMAYHLAAEGPRHEAGGLIQRVERQAEEGAIDAVRDLVDRLRAERHDVVGLAVAAGNTPMPDALDTILASHALVHAAEGELYRDALASAADVCQLPLTRFAHTHAIAEAAAALGVHADGLDARLRALGKALGPPWQKDHRDAAAAALLVLAG